MEQQATYQTRKPNGKYRQDVKPAGLEEYVFGKVQPQAVELEQAVLGALLLDRDALMLVADILRPEVFYLETHQHIYRAITTLFSECNPVDLLTVTQALLRAGTLEQAGGGHYLTELTHRVASSANIEYHARVVFEKFVARSVIDACTRSIRDAYEATTDVFNMLDSLETQLLRTRDGQTSGTRKIEDVTADVLRQAEAASKAKAAGGIVGIPSGISELDRETGGFRDSNLTIIAGRPGMGKSAMLNTIAINAAKAGFPVGIFSLEMSAVELVQRIVSSESRVDGRRLNSGGTTDQDWQRLQMAVESVNPLPVYIDDTPALNIMQIRAKARRWRVMHGVRVVLVDYLQLMGATDRSGNREQQVAEISRGLKALAKELNVPVVALAQLSRAVETRGGAKRPLLSDLRESGAVEQDADNVLFLYRPEYYGIQEDEQGKSTAGVAEIIVAKNRHGRICHAVTRYIAELTLFEDEKPESTQFPAYTHQPIPRTPEEDIPF